MSEHNESSYRSAVADFIAEWWTRAFEVSKEESSEEEWRICWNPEPTNAAD